MQLQKGDLSKLGINPNHIGGSILVTPVLFSLSTVSIFSAGLWLESIKHFFDINRKDQNFMSDKPLYVNLSIPKHRQLFNYVTMKL